MREVKKGEEKNNKEGDTRGTTLYPSLSLFSLLTSFCAVPTNRLGKTERGFIEFREAGGYTALSEYQKMVLIFHKRTAQEFGGHVTEDPKQNQSSS